MCISGKAAPHRLCNEKKLPGTVFGAGEFGEKRALS